MVVYSLKTNNFYLGSLSESQRAKLGDALIAFASEEVAFDALSSVRGWRDGFSRLVKFRNVLKLYLSSDDYAIGVVPAYRFGYEVNLCSGITCVCISYPLDLRAMGVKDFLGSFMQYAKDAHLMDILPDDVVVRLGIAVGAVVLYRQGYSDAIKYFGSGLGCIDGLSECIEVINAKLDTGFDFSSDIVVEDVSNSVACMLRDDYVTRADFDVVCEKLDRMEKRLSKIIDIVSKLEWKL